MFLEIDPDRGSRHVLDALRSLEVLCRSEDMALLLMDFFLVQNWRSHAPLTEWRERTPVQVALVAPDEILLDGQLFDPHAHFSDWRLRKTAWTEGKAQRIARALEAGHKLRTEGRTYTAIAAELNAKQIRSPTGKPWSASGIRKLLCAQAP